MHAEISKEVLKSDTSGCDGSVLGKKKIEENNKKSGEVRGTSGMRQITRFRNQQNVRLGALYW